MTAVFLTVRHFLFVRFVRQSVQLSKIQGGDDERARILRPR